VSVAVPPVIEVRGVGKRYRVYRGEMRGQVKSLLLPGRRERYSVENVALADIDLQVGKGEVLGVVGRNGSGKSTLLRLIAGMSPPTSGEIEVRGHVRCLLAAGVGFDPRLTGRQNIIIGSIAMGIPKAVAEARVPSIVEFAELEDFIDQPTRFYSSGMRSRLALAVIVQEVSEVLMLDEALSAGDAYFHEKCSERITQICGSGSTLVLVTHSMQLLERLCTRAVMLEHGRMVLDDTPAAVVARYTQGLSDRSRAIRAVPPPPSPGEASEGETDCAPGQLLSLEDAYTCGDDGVRRDRFEHGEPFELHLVLRAAEPIELARFVLELYSETLDGRLTVLGTQHLSAETKDLAIFPMRDLDGMHELVVRWPSNPLGSGGYHWSLAVRPFRAADAGTTLPTELLRVGRLCPFRSVSFPGHPLGERRVAVLEPETEVSLRSIEPESSASVDDGVGPGEPVWGAPAPRTRGLVELLVRGALLRPSRRRRRRG
jgi:ABC-type polysaccharide/polyol phosphate transport system ATPase subunit